MKARYVFAAALVLCTCIPYALPHAFVADDFTADERAALERAAAKWNTIVIEPIRLDGGEWDIRRETPPDFDTKGFIGETSHKDRRVYLMPGLDSATFYCVALHELGHVVGLRHVSGDHSVMRAELTCATEFSQEDLDECRTVGACPLAPIDEAKCRYQGACP